MAALQPLADFSGNAHQLTAVTLERRKDRLRPSGVWGSGWEAVPSAVTLDNCALDWQLLQPLC